jgi:hypothetical protein
MFSQKGAVFFLKGFDPMMLLLVLYRSWRNFRPLFQSWLWLGVEFLGRWPWLVGWGAPLALGKKLCLVKS